MEALFYSVKEMASILGIAERSVYRIKEQIPGYVKIGGQVLFNRRTFHHRTKGHEPVGNAVEFADPHGIT